MNPNKLISKHIVTHILKVTATDMHPAHFINISLTGVDGENLDEPFEVEDITEKYNAIKKKARKVKL